MKEYEFVRVELSTMRRRPKEDYQQIIHDYAKRGWRFVQKGMRKKLNRYD